MNYAPGALAIKQTGSREWELQAAGVVLESFRSEAFAKYALEVARQFKQQCAVGRLPTRVENWAPAVDALKSSFREDCVQHHPQRLTIYHENDRWSVGEPADNGMHGAMVTFDDESSAQVALGWLKQYSFECFIGRKDLTGPVPVPVPAADRLGHVMRYWKK